MAGVRTYRSNRIEVLAEILGSLVRSLPPADPFDRVEIVVGSRGMEHWIRHKLADQIGVSANLSFPFSAKAIDDCVALILGEPSSTPGKPDPWSPAVLVWAILEVLPNLLVTPAFGRTKRLGMIARVAPAGSATWTSSVGLAAACARRRSRPTSGAALATGPRTRSSPDAPQPRLSTRAASARSVEPVLTGPRGDVRMAGEPTSEPPARAPSMGP